MAREAWERTVTDSAGNALTGAQVAVYTAGGITLATIYGQQVGGAPIANPFNTGASTSAKFYADPGIYVVRITKDGQTREFSDVSIADIALKVDLGSAAYLAATTSLTDATPGRVLRVRDFGLGFDAIQVAASGLDAIIANGFYSVIGSAQAPTTAPYEVQHIQFDINSAKQIAYTAGTPATTIHVRVKAGAVWQSWRRIYNASDIIGAVAFSGGVNTGAIIERGNNSNGEFVRFADGTQVCWYQKNGPLTMTNYSSGLHQGYFVWTYPAAFAVLGAISGSHVDSSFTGWLSCNSFTTGSATIGCFSAAATNTGTLSQVMAVGRWRA
jgi:hypothetical protein